jgi:hypothetical protein
MSTVVPKTAVLEIDCQVVAQIFAALRSATAAATAEHVTKSEEFAENIAEIDLRWVEPVSTRSLDGLVAEPVVRRSASADR